MPTNIKDANTLWKSWFVCLGSSPTKDLGHSVGPWVWKPQNPEKELRMSALSHPTQLVLVCKDVSNCMCVFDFLVFLSKFFMVLNYSKMANLGFWTYSNTFWNMFGTSICLPNLDLHTPYLLQKYFKRYKTNYRNLSWKSYKNELYMPTCLKMTELQGQYNTWK